MCWGAKVNAKIFLLSSFFLISSGAQAEDFMLTKQRPVIAERLELMQATDFFIENPNGRIEMFGSGESELIVTAEHDGELPMKVSLDRSNAGKVIVTVIDGSDGADRRASRDANASHGGLVIRGGGVVMIDRKIVSAAPGGGLFVGGGRVVRLKLQMPAQWTRHIRATSRNGEVTLHGKLTGPLAQGRQIALTSQNGDVACDGILAAAGQVHLISRNGQIAATEIDSNLLIETDNGDVVAQRNHGDIDVKSVNGDVTVTAQSGGRVHAVTTNGDVRLNNPSATTESANAKHGEVQGLVKRGYVTED